MDDEQNFWEEFVEGLELRDFFLDLLRFATYGAILWGLLMVIVTMALMTWSWLVLVRSLVT